MVAVQLRMLGFQHPEVPGYSQARTDRDLDSRQQKLNRNPSHAALTCSSPRIEKGLHSFPAWDQNWKPSLAQSA